MHVAESYAHSSPYKGSWLQHFCRGHFIDLYKTKVIKEQHLRELIEMSKQYPAWMIFGNFVVERAGMVNLCRSYSINSIHTEDGFFPHYDTIHADPMGFCWESSLSRLVYRGCTEQQRETAEMCREQHNVSNPVELPDEIKEPYVFWPLQLIGDKVNQWDLNLSNWCDILRHFRESLPTEVQLVIKEHPRSKGMDNIGLSEFVKKFKNVKLVDKKNDLNTLVRNSCAVAGANSTVLYLARLIYLKPVYTYARGWFTGHSEIFLPLQYRAEPRPLPALRLLEDSDELRKDRARDYANWFLAQLLGRQISHRTAGQSAVKLRSFVDRLSYDNFIKYGEDIFDVSEHRSALAA